MLQALLSWNNAGRFALMFFVWKCIAVLRKWIQAKHRLLTNASASSSLALKRTFTPCKTYFVTSHGLYLYQRKWLPRYDQPLRGIVFLVHGLGEHGGRYDHVARALAKNGFAVFMIDHQGHGLSDGDRMYAKKLLHLAEDYMEFIRHTLKLDGGNRCAHPVDPDLDAHATVDWKTLPRFLLGHSMGGVISLQLVELSHAQDLAWNGLVLSAPAIYCSPLAKFRPILLVLTKLAEWLPKFTLPVIEASELTQEYEVVTRMARDPIGMSALQHGSTLSLGASLVHEGLRFAKQDTVFTTNQLTTPLFVLHGEKDAVTFPKGTVKFYSRYSGKDKTIKLVPDALHETFQSDLRDELLQEIVGWMDERL